MIEGFIMFRRKKNGRAKASDEHWKMEEEMKFGFGHQDTRCALCADGKKIVDDT